MEDQGNWKVMAMLLDLGLMLNYKYLRVLYSFKKFPFRPCLVCPVH